MRCMKEDKDLLIIDSYKYTIEILTFTYKCENQNKHKYFIDKISCLYLNVHK